MRESRKIEGLCRGAANGQSRTDSVVSLLSMYKNVRTGSTSNSRLDHDFDLSKVQLVNLKLVVMTLRGFPAPRIYAANRR